MSCRFEQDLTAYLDHELDALRDKQVALHLSDCETCRSLHGLLSRTVEGLSLLPEFQPSRDLRRQVLAKVATEPEPPSWSVFRAYFFRPAVWGTLAGACAAVWVTWMSQRQPPKTPLDGADVELASNLELAQDLELLGTRSPEDVDVVLHLRELEANP
jgi:anti-sigma factor RsiW